MLDKVQKIKFNGLNFILPFPNDSDSPVISIEAYKKGECSYAHYYSEGDGVIVRFFNKIGTTKDIEFGEMIEIEVDCAEFAEGLLGNTWSVNKD